jgi:hypothetical protein
MAATYPNLLAGGVTALGRFDPFDLYGGESDIVTDQGQAADGVAILQFQVLTRDGDGRLIPFVAGTDYATGSYVVGGQPTAADTITVNGVVLTFRAAPTLADEIAIGTDATATAANIAARINLEPERFHVSATSSGTTVSLIAEEIGVAGDTIAIAEGVTSASFTVSGATLTDSTTAENVLSGKAIGIAAQPVPATTPGVFLPIYTGGVFNHEALVWPAGIVTLDERKRAFDGTNIGVRQLL